MMRFTPLLPVLALFVLSASLTAADKEELFKAKPLTEEKSFTAGIEGPNCDAKGNTLRCVNFRKKTGPSAASLPMEEGEVWVELPGKSVGNGIVFDTKGMMYVADYVGHNVLMIDPATKKITVFAHEDKMSQPNDLAIAPDDTLYASDPDWNKSTGQVWRIDRDGKVTLAAEKIGDELERHRGQSRRQDALRQ